MSSMRRALAVLGAAGGLALAAPAAALAAPGDPAPPPVANCGFFSAFVCQVPVSILVPVNIESVFPPQPTPTG